MILPASSPVDSKHALVAVIEKLSGHESAVELWNLDSGKFINERVVPRAPVSNSTRHHGSFEGGGVQFSEDASLPLIGGAFTEPSPVRILQTADLSPVPGQNLIRAENGVIPRCDV